MRDKHAMPVWFVKKFNSRQAVTNIENRQAKFFYNALVYCQGCPWLDQGVDCTWLSKSGQVLCCAGIVGRVFVG